MTTLFYSHLDCLQHDPGSGYPESPQRLGQILERLNDPEFAPLLRRKAPKIDAPQISRVHDIQYVQSILQISNATETVEIDADTRLTPQSADPILRSAGAVIAAVDDVMTGKASNAFCAGRPPGHHASKTQAMGFCFFNNVALGAHHVMEAYGLERVAIMDFDVHHGNGTQSIFKEEPRVFFASTHQWMIFPKTGAADETGVGNLLNVPLARGTKGDRFRQVFDEQVIPALDAFAPEFLFISAGFDAHIADTVGGLKLVDSDFDYVTGLLADVADKHAKGRLVSVLEGGYNPRALAASVASHLRVLMSR
jgi:acetoin utilization deacetylase AcuC-like enzyme